MKDYHIYTHYMQGETQKKTSPNYSSKDKKTKAAKGDEEEALNFAPAVSVGRSVLATAMVVNQFVGAWTENTVTASRRQTAGTYAAMASLAFSNPITAVGAIAVYTIGKKVSYDIMANKKDLSAEFMRDLSGGTVKTRG